MKVLLWDIDGTLLNTCRAGMYAWVQALEEEHGGPVDVSGMRVAGMTDESVAMVFVECEGRPLEEGGVGSEQIEVQLVSRAEAGRLCENEALKFDAKAWLVISAFARYGEI